MNSQSNKSFIQTLLEPVISVSIVLTFILLTVVVIMLVTGTLHVLSRNFLQPLIINIISVVVSVIIIILSASFLIRTFQSIRSTVIKALFHDQDNK